MREELQIQFDIMDTNNDGTIVLEMFQKRLLKKTGIKGVYCTSRSTKNRTHRCRTIPDSAHLLIS